LLLACFAHSTSSITVNKNAVHGDQSALTPGGVRLGTPALTSRSFSEKDFERVAEFLHRAVDLSLKAQSLAGSKMMMDFVAVLSRDEIQVQLASLRNEIQEFARGFPMPGI
jgi:glycine hydroxymethyltransferase